jgi:hypothetical protein
LNDSDPCPKFLQFAATTASFFNWLLWPRVYR